MPMKLISLTPAALALLTGCAGAEIKHVIEVTPSAKAVEHAQSVLACPTAKVETKVVDSNHDLSQGTASSTESYRAEGCGKAISFTMSCATGRECTFDDKAGG